MGYVFLYAVLLATVRFNALALDGGWNVRKR
jgi:thiosulfate dehydrogenase [quinone] large subunit